MRPSRQQSSGFGYEPQRGRSVEWYTPPEVFAALGIDFDLDPAAPTGGVPWVPVWFHRAFHAATAVCFIKRRLRFVPGDEHIRPTRTAVAARAPSLLLAYGLPCAVALAECGLGQTCLVPGGQRS